MDFVHDQTHDGRAFRILTVIDQWSRESVCLQANFRLSGRCVAQVLDEVARHRGWPNAITVDNGTEFTSKALAGCQGPRVRRHGVAIESPPGIAQARVDALRLYQSTVLAMPSRSGMRGSQPRDFNRDTSRSLRGVPSGFVVSCTMWPV